MKIVIMYYSLNEFHISSETNVLLLLHLYTSPGGGDSYIITTYVAHFHVMGQMSLNMKW